MDKLSILTDFGPLLSTTETCEYSWQVPVTGEQREGQFVPACAHFVGRDPTADFSDFCSKFCSTDMWRLDSLYKFTQLYIQKIEPSYTIKYIAFALVWEGSIC